VLNVLTLPEEIEANIRRDVMAALPNEAVGLVGGAPDGAARLVIPLPNIAGRGAFFAEPYAQFKALKLLRAEGLQLLAIYHSHPGGGVQPSASDLEWGSDWPCAHLIVAVGDAASNARPANVRMQAWHYGPNLGQFDGIPLVIGSI
jgi:[CysO sulfur-carrier protein]-S-L-cysteine hydrolase